MNANFRNSEKRDKKVELQKQPDKQITTRKVHLQRSICMESKEWIQIEFQLMYSVKRGQRYKV
jgi:hypothetical protein